MTEGVERPPRRWRGAGDNPYRLPGAVYECVGLEAQAGDSIGAGARAPAWRGLRHQLHHRGLAVVALGRRFFVLPEEALPEVPRLREMAHEAATDRAVLGVLEDFLQEKIGLPPGLAKLLAKSFARACAAGNHRAVPGGELHAGYVRGESPPAVTINQASVRDLSRRTAKLSKLQRSILGFARDHDNGGGAPLALWPPLSRSEAAAFSRALRRLEQRHLLWVDRVGGRARTVRLGHFGTQAVNDR